MKFIRKNIFIIIFITFICVKIIFNNINFDKEVNNKSIKEEKTPEIKIVIDIEGAVSNPGMYEITDDIRMGELIEKAGGFTQANKECVNLAKKIKDEDYIKIPYKNEMCENEESLTQKKENNTISINKSGKEELEKLKGIGETRAEDIIKYREENNGFSKKEDLKNVKGIGEATYEKIKDEISV